MSTKKTQIFYWGEGGHDNRREMQRMDGIVLGMPRGGKMPIQHKKNFGIYHWDTFDNAVDLVGEADTREEAEEMVLDKYGDSIRWNGADVIHIVDRVGNVIKEFPIG